MDVPGPSHHPPLVQAPETYIAALSIPTLDRLLLGMVAEARLRKRNWTPSEARWGEVVHRCRETISRSVNRLARAGWLRVVRRGRRLTNIYLLSRTLWHRFTGQPRRRWDPELQGSLWRLGTAIGVAVEQMASFGIREPVASQ